MLDLIDKVSHTCCNCMFYNQVITLVSKALLFSATFKKKVEYLCRDTLTDPIRVVIGELGEVIFSLVGYVST